MEKKKHYSGLLDIVKRRNNENKDGQPAFVQLAACESPKTPESSKATWMMGDSGDLLHGSLPAWETCCMGDLLHWRLCAWETCCIRDLLHGRLAVWEA